MILCSAFQHALQSFPLFRGDSCLLISSISLWKVSKTLKIMCWLISAPFLQKLFRAYGTIQFSVNIVAPLKIWIKTFYSFPWPLLLNVKAKLHRTIPKKLYVWNRVFLLSFDDFDTFPHFKLSTRVSSYRTMWTFLPGNYKNMCLLFFMFSPSGKGRGKQSLPGRVCWLLQF